MAQDSVARGDAAISVTDLTKSYGLRRVLDGLSFEVRRGEVFALLGPNGAGKTTTVEILEGYRARDGGTVEVLGIDPSRRGSELRTQVGLMLQEGGLYPGLRVGEALRLFASFYPNPEDPGRLLEEAGLADHRDTLIKRLSGGQRQRLSMALALVGRPQMIFLDEPTAGMDPHARATTWEQIADLRRRGVTVLLTTHYIEEAEQLADRVAIVDRGRLVATGTPESLTQGLDRVELRTSRPIDAAALAGFLSLPVSEPLGKGTYVVEAAPTPELVSQLADWLRDRGTLMTELSAGRRSLEATFLKLTAEAAESGNGNANGVAGAVPGAVGGRRGHRHRTSRR
jgi:ABC-2 type transport system ATP-binding protein